MHNKILPLLVVVTIFPSRLYLQKIVLCVASTVVALYMSCFSLLRLISCPWHIFDFTNYLQHLYSLASFNRLSSHWSQVHLKVKPFRDANIIEEWSRQILRYNYKSCLWIYITMKWLQPSSDFYNYSSGLHERFHLHRLRFPRSRLRLKHIRLNHRRLFYDVFVVC